MSGPNESRLDRIARLLLESLDAPTDAPESEEDTDESAADAPEVAA